MVLFIQGEALARGTEDLRRLFNTYVPPKPFWLSKSVRIDGKGAIHGVLVEGLLKQGVSQVAARTACTLDDGFC